MSDARSEPIDGARAALIDILIVAALSVAAFSAELALADYLPWGAEARGVLAVLAGAIAAVWLTLARGGTFGDLGFRRPARWATLPFWVFGIFVVFVIAQNLVPVVLSPVFDLEPPDMSRYDIIRGNLPIALLFALMLPLTAAVPEEILYRGFLIGRLSRLFAGVRAEPALAVSVQALIFGSIHFQWGVGGIVMTTIMGIVWGTAYLLCGRNLWIVILAHSAAHVALVTILYSAPVT